MFFNRFERFTFFQATPLRGGIWLCSRLIQELNGRLAIQGRANNGSAFSMTMYAFLLHQNWMFLPLKFLIIRALEKDRHAYIELK